MKNRGVVGLMTEQGNFYNNRSKSLRANVAINQPSLLARVWAWLIAPAY